jgi:hypothetical protein
VLLTECTLTQDKNSILEKTRIFQDGANGNLGGGQNPYM